MDNYVTDSFLFGFFCFFLEPFILFSSDLVSGYNNY